MSKTTIEWTDTVWNPVTGCTKVSQGCKNCYAETIANRFWGDRKFSDIQLHPERLEQPLHWKKPRMIFVNSMSDLFHEKIPFEFIDKIWGMMAATPEHIYQVLTKRPQRLLEYFEDNPFRLPFNNIWIGVSVEDQETADERIPALFKFPSSVKWISAEPLLGQIDILKYLRYWRRYRLDWVVVGGESGHKARPMHPDWVRKIRDDCKEADVPFFFKQWGNYIPSYQAGNDRVNPQDIEMRLEIAG